MVFDEKKYKRNYYLTHKEMFRLSNRKRRLKVNKPLLVVKCAYCIKEFKQTTPQNKYCSPYCCKMDWKRKHSNVDKDYYWKHRKEYTLSAKEWRRKRKMYLISLLGNTCCNPYNLPHPDWLQEPELLQVDHINGGGVKEIKKYGGKYYSYVIGKIENGSKDYQLLCVACNWKKRFKNNEGGNSNN